MTLPLPRTSRLKLASGDLLFWREGGSGPAMVMLHGFWSDGGDWDLLMAELSSEFHCFAPDLPGCGDSRWVQIETLKNPASQQSPIASRQQSFKVDAAVAALADYLTTLRIRQVYFVGHALGGWVATRYALKYPEQVAGLVLLAPAGLEDRRWFGRWYSRRFLVWQGAGKLLAMLRFLLAPLGLRGTLNNLLRYRSRLLASPTASSLLLKPRRELWSEVLSSEGLARLKVPTLLLQGEQDPEIPLAHAQVFNQHIAHSHLVVTNGGHSLHQEKPAQVANWIRKFIAELEPIDELPVSPRKPNPDPVVAPGVGPAEDHPHP
ncbi:alpha/beta fold hydrolase [Leptolyngbya sp. FACHB-261]|uniref:alpha/beta fold hydrolase n=1 Tax=Leptolyngbya sp. FACHB-261 TaxID=2692806 RepID=UPI0016856AEF|nr:alpha/beta hydrolase [Leptolyngbya sp. FACHB-261]MBD2101563.1 alpha/beta hydrolase [Leptolyngbya sp. FACHB-261]